MQIDENTPINVLNYLKMLDSFPNAYITYKILLTIHVTVVSAKKKKKFFKTKINKILFKVSTPVTVTYKILLIKNYT